MTSTLTIEATYSEIKWYSEWKAEGTVVLLPLNVVTPLEAILSESCACTGNFFSELLILVEPVFTLKFDLQQYEKGGTYFRVVDTGIDLQARGLAFDFKLFSNERLNREFNSAMTEKGAEIFAACKPLEQVYAPLFGTIFNGFLEKVPVAELFKG